MPLSKHHIDTQHQATSFDVDSLGGALQGNCPEINFAFLMGSAVHGVIAPHSDLDIAAWINVKPSWDIYDKIFRVCDSIIPGIRCDFGVLNQAEPVYRYEAIKGRLLFTRDQEQYLRFYSLTCREYESQLFDYERQRHYRLTT